jgi:hypothetical protein
MTLQGPITGQSWARIDEMSTCAWARVVRARANPEQIRGVAKLRHALLTSSLIPAVIVISEPGLKWRCIAVLTWAWGSALSAHCA